MIKKAVILFFILSLGVFAQDKINTDTPTTEQIVNSTLSNYIKAIQTENWSEAQNFFLKEGISENQLKEFSTIVQKVQSYLDNKIISPSPEGIKLISIPLRQSVIYLHRIENKWHFTDGTINSIEKLSQMADLLSTPQKTLQYFVNQVQLENFKEANKCFVQESDTQINSEKLTLLQKVVTHILEKKVEGKFQGNPQTSTLVTFPIENHSIALVRESGDWLITINTRNKINVIFQVYKANHVNSIVPASLNNTLFLMKNWQWLGIVVILFIGIIAQWLLQAAFKKTVLAKLNMGNELKQKPKFPSITILCMSLSWYLLLPLLSLEVESFKIFSKAAILIIMVSGMFVVARGLDLLKDILLIKAQKTNNKVDDVLIPMFHKIVKLAVYIVGIVLVASNIGINVASLLAGLGLAGMAFALAAKDTVENIFGSVTVLTDKPFEVGDWVVINGVEGTVEQIGLRSTRIRTFYCSQVNVPNSTLIKATVDNYGRRTFRRVKTYLSLTYDTPPEKIEAFCEGVRELIRNHPHTRKDYYQVFFNQFNSASLDVLLYCFIDTEDWAIELRERQRLFLDIMRLAAKLKVEFAFPTQTLHMANKEDLYPPVTHTDLDAISAAYLSGKENGSQIIAETQNNSKTPFPNSFDYLKGTPYTEPKG